MAINNINKKLSIMEWGNVWEPGLPILPGTLGQDDKQQLLWGYAGILWSTVSDTIRFTSNILQNKKLNYSIKQKSSLIKNIGITYKVSLER